MIPKASQRGGGQQLATHLMNAIDNERVELLALRGSVARDLHGAFAEWEAQSSATKCRKYLYSLSINPDPRQRQLSRQEIADFIHRIEKRLGLEQQPRAVVCHVKQGREHFHVAWSRIDLEKMKAVQLSNDRYKIRAAVREFAKEKQLELPGRLKDKFNQRSRQESLAERQQQERTGISKDERRKEITQAWRRSDTAQAFLTALKDKGYTLAQGDKRGYVVIDRHGEIHSLARQIEGVKTKQITERLRDFPPDKLPTASTVREQRRKESTISLKDFFKLKADNQRTTLLKQQQARRAPLQARKKALEERQNAERTALLALQRDRNKALAEQRREAEPTGLAKWLGKVTGMERLRKTRQQQADTQRKHVQQESLKQLTARHERERREIARHLRALSRVEKRELRTLQTKIRREILTQQRSHQRTPERTPERTTERKHERTVEPQTPKLFTENARDITAPAAPPAAPSERASTGGLSDKFIEALKKRAEEKQKQKQPEKDRSRDRGPRSLE